MLTYSQYRAKATHWKLVQFWPVCWDHSDVHPNLYRAPAPAPHAVLQWDGGCWCQRESTHLDLHDKGRGSLCQDSCPCSHIEWVKVAPGQRLTLLAGVQPSQELNINPLASATNPVKADSAIIHTEATLLSHDSYSSLSGSAFAPTRWGYPLSRVEIHLTPAFGSSLSISSPTSQQGDSWQDTLREDVAPAHFRSRSFIKIAEHT